MKYLLLTTKVVTALVATVIISFGVLDYLLPDQFVRGATWLGRSAAGLERKEIGLPGKRVAYLEGGHGRPVILLHGFGANKDTWLPVAPALTRQFRVIAPDLPCFGESTKLDAEACRIEDQIQYLSELASALKLEHFDLGGNSMGGWIAAAYAAAHPGQVSSLWLIDAAGVSSARDSDFMAGVRAGRGNPLLGASADDFRTTMEYLFVTVPPTMTHAMQRVMAEQMVASHDYNSKIFDQIRSGPPLEPLVANLRMPVLVMWGNRDRITDASAAEVLKRLIPAAEVNILPGVGHLPMVEAPGTAASGYIKFLSPLPPNF